jgi:hypothetical protein
MPDNEYELSFESAFYFMIITITTVGYGDIGPKNNMARLIVGVFLVIVIVVTT